MADQDKLTAFFEAETVFDILNTFGELLVDELKESLVKSGHNGGSASDLGTLEQSIRHEIHAQPDGVWQFLIFWEDHGNFINKGVQGMKNAGKRKTDSRIGGGRAGDSWINKAPNSPFKYTRNSKLNGGIFREWARRKGINPWAVAAAVKRTGIRPNKWADKVISPEIFDDLSDEIEKAGGKALEVAIANEIIKSLD